MSITIKDKVAKCLEETLDRPVDIQKYSDDTPLIILGLDSLLTVSVLVGLLEESGVDISEHIDSLVAPSTLGDLFDIAKRFMPEVATASVEKDMPRERRSQLEYYQEKVAYEIDSADLKEALLNGQNIIVVDGRSSESYEIEHIPGAISIPHRSISQNSLSELSKLPLYITYCDGIGCNASTKAAIKLASAGFRVKELIGGLDWWKRDGNATDGTTSQVCNYQVDCGCAD